MVISKSGTYTTFDPLSSGIAANTVPVFDFEKTDCGTLPVSSRIEIIAPPTMDRSTVKKGSDE
jgi:hypothetical protein